MKTTKKDLLSKENTNLKKVVKNKREVSKLKAGASLEKAVRNVQEIVEVRHNLHEYVHMERRIILIFFFINACDIFDFCGIILL